MLDNKRRRDILNQAKASNYEGSVMDLFSHASNGGDVSQMLSPQEGEQMLTASTPQEQETGLRDQHAAGNTGASMSFPDVKPNTSFNTKGMKVPMDISKYDEQGHLVQSFKAVPPGIEDLPTGPSTGTVIETPSYQKGGFKGKYQKGGFDPYEDLSSKSDNTSVHNYSKDVLNLQGQKLTSPTPSSERKPLAYEEPSWAEKMFDRAASPMTAFGYSVRNQDIPHSIPINSTNRNIIDDYVLDNINPFAWVKYAKQADKDYARGEYTDALLNTLAALPVVPSVLSKGKPVRQATDALVSGLLEMVRNARGNVPGDNTKDLKKKQKTGGVKGKYQSGGVKDTPKYEASDMTEEAVKYRITEKAGEGMDPKLLSLADYQKAITNNAAKLEGFKTPYSTTGGVSTEGGMNCIGGVCTALNALGIPSMTKGEYRGNAAFADNANKEGYYDVDPNTDGFTVGDVLQYSRNKGSVAAMRSFDGKVTPKNYYEQWPMHAKLIVGEREGKDGREYNVGHNRGEEDWVNEWKTEAELLGHRNDGFEVPGADFQSLLVNRYDPEKVKSNKVDKTYKQAVLEGQNVHASKYKGKTPSFEIKLEEEDYEKGLHTDDSWFGDGQAVQRSKKDTITDEQNAYLDVYEKNYEALGTMSNLPPEILNMLAHRQLGIGAVESGGYGTDPSLRGLKESIPDVLLPFARDVASWWSDSSHWTSAYWDENAEGVQGEFDNLTAFQDSLTNKNSKLTASQKEWMHNNSPRSTGDFQQKELSARGKHMDADMETKEGQFMASISLSIDNYHRLAKKYPDKTPEEIVDLATQMHNAPSKAMESVWADYYGPKNDMNYVTRVNNNVGKMYSNEEYFTEEGESKIRSTEIKRNGGVRNKYQKGGYKGKYQL